MALLLGFILGLFFQGDLLTVTLFDSFIFSGTEKSRLEQYEENLAIVNDSLCVYVNKNEENEAKILSFNSSNRKYLQDIESKDYLIDKLQNKVKELRDAETVIVHESEIVYRDTGSVQIKYLNKELQYPVSSQKVDKWIDASVDIYEEFSQWNINFKNSDTYAIEKKEVGFLGSGGFEYTVKATSQSPYTKTTGLRSMVIRHKPKKWHLGLFTGYGYSLDNTEFSPIFGVGITYSILSI